MLNVVFQRMEAGSTHVVVPPIVVSDVLGLPPADASNMSAFVQQFLADVIASVDPFGTVAHEIQQVPALGERSLAVVPARPSRGACQQLALACAAPPGPCSPLFPP